VVKHGDFRVLLIDQLFIQPDFHVQAQVSDAAADDKPLKQRFFDMIGAGGAGFLNCGWLV
jgi:hypothetical protein